MFKSLIETFRKPSPDVLAARELDDAERELLKALTGLEYAQCMVDYRTSTVERLTARCMRTPARLVQIGRTA
jgi:hypothetical protein